MIARANAILRPPIVTVTVKSGDTLSEIAALDRPEVPMPDPRPGGSKWVDACRHWALLR